MRKPIFLLACFFLTINFLAAQEEIYLVELAAFDRTVSNDYWQGLDDVTHIKDHNDLHRYYIGSYHTQNEAEKLRSKARELGFNARVINWEEIQQYCYRNCFSYSNIPPVDPKTLKNIFFDFDRSSLRAPSRAELNQLFILMKQNPGYRAEFAGHTDFKGSDEYNVALSRRRAETAKAYLVNKGIAARRVDATLHGEGEPIAKNELTGGLDTEEGRQFNRRVEIRIFDESGNRLNGIVEEINVPQNLKIETIQKDTLR